jgi:DNA-directed RNA polymerase subunit H (RpoH/RPB5)
LINKNDIKIVLYIIIFSKMSTISSRIISIYKSRTTLLAQLQKQGYNVDDYSSFTINEIDSMLSNSQLDMLINHSDKDTKIYIKYYFTLKQTTKQIKKEVLDNIIEDLFTIDEVLTKKDTLMVIIDDEPNDTILTKMKYLYNHDGIFVIIHNIHRLQYNILDHTLVPYMRVLDAIEEVEFMKTKQIQDKSQLPEISRFDPQALVIGLRPGDICLIERASITALKTNYYRVCV